MTNFPFKMWLNQDGCLCTSTRKDQVIMYWLLISLIFTYAVLLGFQFSKLSQTLSFALLFHRPPFRVFDLLFVFSHALFLLALLLHRPPFWVFNLPFYIYIYIYIFCSFLFFFFFFFWHKNIEMRCTERLLHAKYCMTASKLVGILKSCSSMSARIKAPLEKAFFTTYGPL